MPDPLEVFAANLRRAREHAGITQEEVALRMATDLSNISRYEGGQRNPTFRTLARLAAAVGVEPAALLENVPPADLGARAE